MAERLPLGHDGRQAGAARALLAAVAGVMLVVSGGCATRAGRCAEFVDAADACMTQAGEDAFFAENVDCDAPVSSIREYTCLIESYERATEGSLCRDRASVELLVDYISLECLGWSGDLSGDDSADDDDSAR